MARLPRPRRVLQVLLLALSLWAQGAWAQQQRTGRLSGRVFVRGSINALSGAQVQARTGESATADGGGRFELVLPEGRSELTILAAGHRPERAEVRLLAGQRLEVEYRLLPLPEGGRFSARVQGEGRHEGERFELRGEEMRTLPGTLGEPLRVLGLLPGVATPLPILPIYVIRGASPGMNGFFLDGMRIPQLYHLLVGEGVTHARLIDQIDFFPGAYDASFGHFAGGIADIKTRPARSDGQHGELELRVFDASALAELSLPRGVRLTLSGHYGFPGPLVHAIDERAGLSYWDYQLRLDWKGLTVQALGSYDAISLTAPQNVGGVQVPVTNTYRITFHRVQVREQATLGRLSLEAAVVGGYDEMTIFQGYGVEKLSLGVRASASLRWRRFHLRAGLDGELSRFTPANFGADVTRARPDDLGELGTARDGLVGGAYLMGTADLGRLRATLGVRADAYHAGTVTLVGLDPRMQLSLRLTDWLSLQAGGGLYQQPPSFPVPLPGIDTFALSLGLQRAIHGALSEELKLPGGLTLKAGAFYERFLNSNDVVVDITPILCTSPPPEILTGYLSRVTRQVDGQSYGMELLLRRQAGRVTGWVAYTLGRSERAFSCGLAPADYDQTHVLNVVVQVRLPWNLSAGARLFVQSGRPVTALQPPDGTGTVRNGERLPTTVQLDLRIDREWIFRRFAIAAFVEAVNVTYGQAVLGLTYPVVDGITRYDQPQVNGFNWILPSIGVRGRF